jgi:hypothetical protein
MEYSVKLSRLPESVVFPEKFRDRIAYDPQRKRLTYRGFMYKHTFDALAELFADFDYQRALEQLFMLTAKEMESG